MVRAFISMWLTQHAQGERGKTGDGGGGRENLQVQHGHQVEVIRSDLLIALWSRWRQACAVMVIYHRTIIVSMRTSYSMAWLV